MSFADVNSNKTPITNSCCILPQCAPAIFTQLCRIPYGFDVLNMIARVAFMVQLSRLDCDCVLPRLVGFLAAVGNERWILNSTVTQETLPMMWQKVQDGLQGWTGFFMTPMEIDVIMHQVILSLARRSLPSSNCTQWCPTVNHCS